MGIGRRIADLWGFCGARKSPVTCLASRHGTQVIQPLVAGDTVRMTQGYQAARQPGGNSAKSVSGNGDLGGHSAKSRYRSPLRVGRACIAP